MQNLNIQIKDELLPVFMKMIAGFGNDIIVEKLEDNIFNSEEEHWENHCENEDEYWEYDDCEIEEDDSWNGLYNSLGGNGEPMYLGDGMWINSRGIDHWD